MLPELEKQLLDEAEAILRDGNTTRVLELLKTEKFAQVVAHEVRKSLDDHRARATGGMIVGVPRMNLSLAEYFARDYRNFLGAEPPYAGV